MPKRSSWFAASLLAVSCVVPAHAAGKAFEFPPVTAEEKALTEVPGFPNAAAVVLSSRGEAELFEGLGGQLAGKMSVHLRFKVLTSAGLSIGEVKLSRQRFGRIRGLRGRTILPDGSVVELPRAAIFGRRVSANLAHLETVAAFPAVEVGAILDLHFEIHSEYAFALPPWDFTSDLPTLRSEVTYRGEESQNLGSFLSNPIDLQVTRTVERDPPQLLFRGVATQVPPTPSEPFGFADRDLSVQMMVYRKEIWLEGRADPWRTSLEPLLSLITNSYRDLRGGLAPAWRELEPAIRRLDRGAAAREVYRYVRDRLRTEADWGVQVEEEARLDTALNDGHATPTLKAILLLQLLRKAGLESNYLFTSSLGHGNLDIKFPAMTQVERVLVTAEIDGVKSVLDPADPCLAFGKLAPGFQGRKAYHSKNSWAGEIVSLPRDPAADNRRRAELELELRQDGSMTGTGRLSFEGAGAWEACHLGRSKDSAEEAWKREIDGRFGNRLPLRVSSVEIVNEVDAARYEVRFRLDMAAEESAIEELSLDPARPWGPFHQVLLLRPDERKTAVVLPYAHVEEIDLTLRWPAEWKLDVTPEPSVHFGYAGALEVSVQPDASARELHLRRRLTLHHQRFDKPNTYAALQRLYAELEKSDAQAIVLVRR